MRPGSFSTGGLTHLRDAEHRFRKQVCSTV